MKTSEKIIKRLYDMGAIDSLDCNVYLHRGSRNGSFSWAISCGSKAIACIKEKRHYIGFELNKEYFDKACKRITEETRQLSLF